MLVEGILFLLVIGLGYWVFYLHTNRAREINNELSKLGQVVAVHDEVRTFLRAGMYQHFCKKDGENPGEEEFPRFVAKVVMQTRGGDAEFLPEGADGAASIVHRLEDSVYLGQTRCIPPEQALGYEPVALLHSRIVREQAQGGFLVITGTFSHQAVDYAQDAGIELIDGEQLLDMWLETVRNTEERIEGELRPQTV